MAGSPNRPVILASFAVDSASVDLVAVVVAVDPVDADPDHCSVDRVDTDPDDCSVDRVDADPDDCSVDTDLRCTDLIDSVLVDTDLEEVDPDDGIQVAHVDADLVFAYVRDFFAHLDHAIDVAVD